jgi:hypothetical protein
LGWGRAATRCGSRQTQAKSSFELARAARVERTPARRVGPRQWPWRRDNRGGGSGDRGGGGVGSGRVVVLYAGAPRACVENEGCKSHQAYPLLATPVTTQCATQTAAALIWTGIRAAAARRPRFRFAKNTGPRRRRRAPAARTACWLALLPLLAAAAVTAASVVAAVAAAAGSGLSCAPWELLHGGGGGW